VIKNTFQFSCD